MIKRFLVGIAFMLLAGPALAQSGGHRFCNQYAAQASDVAAQAIARNPACLDYTKGVHSVTKMHYDWCMQNPRDTVHGAADNIRRLAQRCTAAAGAFKPRADILGTVWHETEQGWQGTWRRIGNSNRFTAEWTHPNGGFVRADLTMTVSGGNRLSVIRRDTFGPGVGRGCQYSGVIFAGTVRGQYSCDLARGPFPWSAQIR